MNGITRMNQHDVALDSASFRGAFDLDAATFPSHRGNEKGGGSRGSEYRHRDGEGRVGGAADCKHTTVLSSSTRNSGDGGCRIHLLLVFLLQVLVVAGAFAAAILVLTEQQRSEFENALYLQLAMQQEMGMKDISTPLFERRTTFRYVVQQYLGNPHGYKRPADNSSVGDMESWINSFYILTQNDSLIQGTTFAYESSTQYPLYPPNYPIYTMWFIEKGFSMLCKNETSYVCYAPAPHRNITAECPAADSSNPTSIYINTNNVWGGPEGFKGVEVWGPPNWYYSEGVTGLYRFMSFTYTPNPTQRPIMALALTFALTHMKPIIERTLAKPSSRSAVFCQYYRFETDVTEYYLIDGKFDFPDMSPIDPSERFQSGIWRGGRTPDAVLNAAFEVARHVSVGATGSDVFELTVGGTAFVAAAARMFDKETDLDWLLVQYTPRKEFYEASDRTRLVGIVIGVVCAVAVLISCILIWLAIYVPLQRLHGQMALAAEMRNDEAAAGSRTIFLKEVGDLNAAFLQMNRRLMRARPFLPQSLLAPEPPSDDNDDAEAAVDMPQIFNTDEVGTKEGPSGEGSEVSTGGRQGAKTNGPADGLAVLRRNIAISRDFENRYVGVLCINVRGFHAATADATPDTLKGLHTTLTGVVGLTASEDRGLLDYFHGDRFVVSYNTARKCPDPSKSGARTAIKLWDRFRAHEELSRTFGGGLSMGLSVGRAAVGNHGTEMMQRLGTIGPVYTEATRLQDVMSRRVLSGRIPGVGGRCLMMGRVVQDVAGCMLYQVVGAVEAAHVMASAEGSLAAATQYAQAMNACMRPPTARADAPTVPRTSALVAVLIAVADSKEDYWLYQNDWVPRNPHQSINDAICGLWLGGILKVPARYEGSPKAPRAGVSFVPLGGDDSRSTVTDNGPIPTSGQTMIYLPSALKKGPNSSWRRSPAPSSKGQHNRPPSCQRGGGGGGASDAHTPPLREGPHSSNSLTASATLASPSGVMGTEGTPGGDGASSIPKGVRTPSTSVALEAPDDTTRAGSTVVIAHADLLLPPILTAFRGYRLGDGRGSSSRGAGGDEGAECSDGSNSHRGYHRNSCHTANDSTFSCGEDEEAFNIPTTAQENPTRFQLPGSAKQHPSVAANAAAREHSCVTIAVGGGTTDGSRVVDTTAHRGPASLGRVSTGSGNAMAIGVGAAQREEGLGIGERGGVMITGFRIPSRAPCAAVPVVGGLPSLMAATTTTTEGWAADEHHTTTNTTNSARGSIFLPHTPQSQLLTEAERERLLRSTTVRPDGTVQGAATRNVGDAQATEGVVGGGGAGSHPSPTSGASSPIIVIQSTQTASKVPSPEWQAFVEEGMRVADAEAAVLHFLIKDGWL